MNPKTFEIHLRQPFGIVTQEAYIFYLHVDSREAAFEWIARVFDGIDLRQTPAAHRPRIGCTDAVTVTDCDVYKKRVRGPGGFKVLETPAGHFRHADGEVIDRLHNIFKNLQSERKRLAQSFSSMKMSYERDGRDWEYERLVLIQGVYAKAVRWEGNVWQEYFKAATKDPLVLPEKRLPPVLKHIVVSAQERTALST